MKYVTLSLNYTYIVVTQIFTQDTVFSRRYHVALRSLKNEDRSNEQTSGSDNPNVAKVEGAARRSRLSGEIRGVTDTIGISCRCISRNCIREKEAGPVKDMW